MKKKSNNNILIAGVITVIIVGGGILAATQDWKSGRNGLVDYARAEMGDAGLQYELGVKARDSKAPGEGPEKAAKWFEKSAAAGNVQAMLALGDLYNAQSDEASGDAAVKWYRKASDAGNMDATVRLGEAYDMGRGSLVPDRHKSRPLFEKAAKAGNPEGENLFGSVLLQESAFGDAAAREKKLKEAETWLLRASKDGNAQADGTLGNIYYDTHSPLKDMDKAFYHYSRACNGGMWPVMLNLAYMHLNGVSTKKDPAEAYKWILLEADMQPREMRTALAFLRAELSPAELADGVKRAAAWRKAHPDYKAPEHA